MNAKADYQLDPADGGALRFTGNLSLATLGDLPERLDREDASVKRIDLSKVERIDTVGAWLIHRFAARNDAAIEGLDDNQRNLVDTVVEADQPVAMRPKPVSPFARVAGEVGDAVIAAFKTLYGLLGFMGATVLAGLAVIRHPRRFRFNAVVHEFETVGVSALAIIGLMSFLIGIVIAQ
ncbi:ABC transporter permease, partial [Sphingomonas sp. NPDC019816]